MKVLVVEDNPIIANGICEMIAAAGHECVGVAATLAEALKIAAENPPDVAIVDIALRDGITGWAVASELQRRWFTRIVIVSATIKAEDYPDFVVLSKPVEPDRILQAVLIN